MAGQAVSCLILAHGSPSGVGGRGSVGLVAAMERAGGERGLRVGRLAGCPELLQPQTECLCPLPSPFVC